MKNNGDKALSQLISQTKPDAMMMLEALKKANETIAMLSNQLKIAEARWNEIFVIAGTILNKYGRDITIETDDLIPLSPHDYTITVEPVEEMGVRIVRLRHVSEKAEKS